MNHESRLSKPLCERLWDKVAGPWSPGVAWDDCWEFQADWRSRYGYGRIAKPGRSAGGLQAHVVAFEQFFGQLAAGDILRHACSNTCCCNPFHLVPGSYAENNWDRFHPDEVWARAPMAAYA